MNGLQSNNNRSIKITAVIKSTPPSRVFLTSSYRWVSKEQLLPENPDSSVSDLSEDVPKVKILQNKSKIRWIVAKWSSK